MKGLYAILQPYHLTMSLLEHLQKQIKFHLQALQSSDVTLE